MLAIDYGADGVVVISGRLDASQCPAAQKFLEHVEGTVTLDCRGLEYISSAGLGVLLKTQKRCSIRRQAPPTGVGPHQGHSPIRFDQLFEIASG